MNASQVEGDGMLDARYVEFFARFNRQEFFEAHEVLERLWLPARGQTAGDFYKGLIQLAGAFVHLQKGQLRPAGALFRLAGANLERYPARYARLDVQALRRRVEGWARGLEASGYGVNPLATGPPALGLAPD